MGPKVTANREPSRNAYQVVKHQFVPPVVILLAQWSGQKAPRETPASSWQHLAGRKLFICKAQSDRVTWGNQLLWEFVQK